MATLEFPYSESRERYYPLIFLHIRNKNIEADMDALIDSGAVISTFKADVAKRLGIRIEEW